MLGPLHQQLGPLGYLRRRAAFTPASIAGLQLWLKADSLALADGAKVATWPDQSGHGNDATQATTANQPVYKAAVVNGNPVVRYGASGACNLVLASRITTARTIFVVYSPVLDGAMSFMFLIGDTVAFDFHAFGSNTAGVEMFYATYASNSIVSAGSAWVDGVPAVPDSVSWRAGWSLLSLVTSASARIGQFSDDRNLGRSYRGDFAEILIYDSALSDASRVLLETYLNAKYSLY